MTTTTDTAATASIDVAARELRLPAIRGHAPRLADEAKRAKATYLGVLADTLCLEVDDRAERRQARRIHEARFPRLRPKVGSLSRVVQSAGNFRGFGRKGIYTAARHRLLLIHNPPRCFGAWVLGRP